MLSKALAVYSAFLERSGSLPLQVTWDHVPLVTPAVHNVFQPHYHRITWFKVVRSGTWSIWHVDVEDVKIPLSFFHRLRYLEVDGPVKFEFPTIDFYPPFVEVLKCRNIDDDFLSIPTHSLRSFHFLGRRLGGKGEKMPGGLVRLAEFVENCPVLENLEISILGTDENEAAHLFAQRRIISPTVVHLTFSSKNPICITAAIFGQFEKLRNLTLIGQDTYRRDTTIVLDWNLFRTVHSLNYVPMTLFPDPKPLAMILEHTIELVALQAPFFVCFTALRDLSAANQSGFQLPGLRLLRLVQSRFKEADLHPNEVDEWLSDLLRNRNRLTIEWYGEAPHKVQLPEAIRSFPIDGGSLLSVGLDAMKLDS